MMRKKWEGKKSSRGSGEVTYAYLHRTPMVQPMPCMMRDANHSQTLESRRHGRVEVYRPFATTKPARVVRPPSRRRIEVEGPQLSFAVPAPRRGGGSARLPIRGRMIRKVLIGCGADCRNSIAGL